MRRRFISTNDVGRAAATAFDEPDKWVGKEFNLAGDAVTPSEVVQTFKQVTGIVLDAKVAPQLPPPLVTMLTVSLDSAP